MTSKFVNGKDNQGFGVRVYAEGFPETLGLDPVVVLAVSWLDGGIRDSIELDAQSAHTLSEFIREEAERVSRAAEEENKV